MCFNEPMSKTVTSRQRVQNLPSSYDAAIESAMMNAYDAGLREEADDDGEAFWHEVFGQATAD